MIKVELSKGEHEGKTRLFVRFPYDRELVTRIREIPGARWSTTKKVWHVQFSNAAFLAVQEKTARHGIVALIDPEELKFDDPLADSSHLTGKFVLYLRSKRYSENTIRTYLEAIQIFLRFFPDKQVSEITNDDLILFNNEYILHRRCSSSFQNQVVNAIKLFYRVVENRFLNADLIHRPRRSKTLPNVLSKEEVKAILGVQTNTKHRLMLSFVYSCGLRSGELLALKPEHIDSRRNLVIIKQAKGKKDRIVPLSPKILSMVRGYFVAYKPEKFLFEGQFPGNPYDSRSLQQVLKQALKKVGITKPVTLHWLRHSYATHLLENGTDLRYIQELLGHNSSRTTEIYTHVSTHSIQKIVSPFDNL